MTCLNLITAVGLLTFTGIVLVAGSPIRPPIQPPTRPPTQQLRTEILDRIASLLEQDENQMILEFLMNQQVQKESVTGVQEDKQVGEQEEQQANDNKEIAIIQSVSDKQLQVEKEGQQISEALEQETHLQNSVMCRVTIGGHCMPESMN